MKSSTGDLRPESRVGCRLGASADRVGLAAAPRGGGEERHDAP
ncbi:hypothetical protein [Streptomyces sp. NPDC000229]